MALTKLTATTTSTQVLAANTARAQGGLVFENTDTNRCFVLLGDPAIVGAASSTNYSFSLAQNNSTNIVGCAHAVQAVWGTAASGLLLVTEYIS
jgi:hypothetical protein